MNKKIMLLSLLALASSLSYGMPQQEFNEVKENANAAIIKTQENANRIDKNEEAIGNIKNTIKDYNDVKENANSAIIKTQENANRIDKNEEAIGNIENTIKDYNDVKENANSAIIKTQENANRIDKNEEAIAANKNDIAANKDAIATNKAEQDKVNAAQKENNAAQQQAIENLQQDFSQYNGRLSGLESKVDNLDSKMNKGLSLMAAMAAVDFQNVEEGEMAIGAGVGHYGNAQSVAIGVAYSPVQNLNLNLKYSVTAGDVKSSAIGAGASYKFRVK